MERVLWLSCCDVFSCFKTLAGRPKYLGAGNTSPEMKAVTVCCLTNMRLRVYVLPLGDIKDPQCYRLGVCYSKAMPILVRPLLLL